MSDLALYRRNSGDFDLAFDEDKGDLLTSDSLENAVIISIGTYARERKLGRNSNLKPCIGGWWGDALDEKGTLGGFLYEAFHGKLNALTAKSIETLVVEALAWMMEDGVVKNVKCSASVVDDGFITLAVTLLRPDGEREKPFVYELKWRASDEI